MRSLAPPTRQRAPPRHAVRPSTSHRPPPRATPCFPPFVDAAAAAEIHEPAALALLSNLKRTPLQVPGVGTMDAAWVGNGVDAAASDGACVCVCLVCFMVLSERPERPVFFNQPSTLPPPPHTVPPVVLLHGFDSSLLEFRRLLPRFSADGVPAFGVDLIGWGFSDCRPFVARPGAPRPPLGPPQKRDHLAAFIETVLGGHPVVLLGTSLGGAVALDFALARPDLVAGLVLVAPQTYTDGIGPLQALPEWAAR